MRLYNIICTRTEYLLYICIYRDLDAYLHDTGNCSFTDAILYCHDSFPGNSHSPVVGGSNLSPTLDLRFYGHKPVLSWRFLPGERLSIVAGALRPRDDSWVHMVQKVGPPVVSDERLHGIPEKWLKQKIKLNSTWDFSCFHPTNIIPHPKVVAFALQRMIHIPIAFGWKNAPRFCQNGPTSFIDLLYLNSV